MDPVTAARFRARTVALALLGVLGSIHSPCAAAERAAVSPPQLVTDRPDQTESSILVPAGFAQLEAGWVFSREDEAGLRVDTHVLPQSLMRIGLIDELELRVGWTGYVSEQTRRGGVEEDADGAGDAEIGAKARLWNRHGSSSGALIVSVSVPLGADVHTTDRFDPSFRFSASHSLAENLALGYNIGSTWRSAPDPSGERHTLSDLLYTLALGFGDITPRLSAFVELFGEVPASASGKPRHSLDGGFTFLVRPNLQLDFFSGLGLSDEADDGFFGAGVSVRFPS